MDISPAAREVFTFGVPVASSAPIVALNSGKQSDARMEDIPQVLLNIFANDFALMVDKVRYVEQLIFLRLLLRMRFHNGARLDANPALLRQLLVLVQIRLPLVAQADECWILRHPACEVIFYVLESGHTLKDDCKQGTRTNQVGRPAQHPAQQRFEYMSLLC
jgi:hypothetical protein